MTHVHAEAVLSTRSAAEKTLKRIIKRLSQGQRLQSI